MHVDEFVNWVDLDEGALDLYHLSSSQRSLNDITLMWPTDLHVVVMSSSSAGGKLFSTLNGVPLHTVLHPSIL